MVIYDKDGNPIDVDHLGERLIPPNEELNPNSVQHTSTAQIPANTNPQSAPPIMKRGRPKSNRYHTHENTIHECIKKRDLVSVKKFIQDHNVHALNKAIPLTGNTPLHTAVNAVIPIGQDITADQKNTSQEIFWALINAGADPSILNKKEETPLYRMNSHLELAKQLWSKRNTFENEEKKSSVKKGCFQVLSKVWLCGFFTHHNSNDFEELFEAASESEKKKFLISDLSTYKKNPLQIFCTSPGLAHEFNGDNAWLWKMACFLLDNATPEILTASTSHYGSFLELAYQNRKYVLIDYAKSCQNGALKSTIEQFAIGKGYRWEQPIVPMIPTQVMLETILAFQAMCSSILDKNDFNQSRENALLNEYFKVTSGFVQDFPLEDHERMNRWYQICLYYMKKLQPHAQLVTHTVNTVLITENTKRENPGAQNQLDTHAKNNKFQKLE